MWKAPKRESAGRGIRGGAILVVGFAFDIAFSAAGGFFPASADGLGEGGHGAWVAAEHPAADDGGAEEPRRPEATRLPKRISGIHPSM